MYQATKSLFLMFMMLQWSCAGASLDSTKVYFSDLEVCYSNKCIKGVGTLPSKKNFSFTVNSESSIEVLFIQSTMQEQIIYKPKDGTKPFKKKRTAKLSFNVTDKDKEGLFAFTALDRKNGRHSWALLAMAHSLRSCEILCNGKKIKGTDLVCQAKKGTQVKLLSKIPWIKKGEKERYKGQYYTVEKDINGFVGGTKTKNCKVWIRGYERFPMRD